MSKNYDKQPEKLTNQETKTEIQTPKQAETPTPTPTPKKKVVEPTYTVDEFASAPNELGNYSADIVRAALSKDGKESYTIEDAKAIVKKFSEKEVV